MFTKLTIVTTVIILSPRHQVSAGINAEIGEYREGFELVLKKSNVSPICV